MTKPAEKMLLTFFYLGKMVEGGFASAGSSNLTPKGFDTAMDLIEKGEKLTLDDMILCLAASKMVPDDQIEPFSTIMFEIQEEGFQKVMEIASKLESGEIENYGKK